MSLDLQLANSRAFVTGGTRGIGAAVVEVLRNAGARVATTARSLPAMPTQGVHYIAADLATAEGCALVAKSVLAQLGSIDIAVTVTWLGVQRHRRAGSRRLTMRRGGRHSTKTLCRRFVLIEPCCPR